MIPPPLLLLGFPLPKPRPGVDIVACFQVPRQPPLRLYHRARGAASDILCFLCQLTIVYTYLSLAKFLLFLFSSIRSIN